MIFHKVKHVLLGRNAKNWGEIKACFSEQYSILKSKATRTKQMNCMVAPKSQRGIGHIKTKAAITTGQNMQERSHFIISSTQTS